MVASLPDLAWCAGLVDGEGHFGLRQNGYMFLAIGQCDREVLDRFASILGVGSVNGPYSTGRDGWRPIFNYHLSGRHPVRAVAEAMWPWLGTVKRNQFLAALEGAKEIPPPGYCRRGLHKMEESRAVTEKRCRPCRNERARERAVGRVAP